MQLHIPDWDESQTRDEIGLLVFFVRPDPIMCPGSPSILQVDVESVRDPMPHYEGAERFTATVVKSVGRSENSPPDELVKFSERFSATDSTIVPSPADDEPV